MNTKKLYATALAATAGAALPFVSLATVPEVTTASMVQDTASRRVTITYTLTDAPAVVTLDIQTNATANAAGDDPGWVSIGGEAVWNAAGDVWKKVEPGSRTITWRPDLSWPDHKIESDCARAVVTAWALDNTPPYMVVALDLDKTADGAVTYYPGAEYLPKASYEQTGAAVTGNPAYKTNKLLMRKIMASGIPWTMGSSDAETIRVTDDAREKTHSVTLTNNYYIGVFQITQRQWANIATNSTRKAKYSVDGDMRPMEYISYNEIRNSNSSTADPSHNWPADPSPVSFLGNLRARTGLDFDLPSEAEWELAARAGYGSGYWGDGSQILNNNDNDGNLGRIGRYKGSNPGGNAETTTFAPDEGGTAIVGSYEPNAWGLYDMNGNVREWCLDWYQVNITSYNGKVNISRETPSKCLDGTQGGTPYRVTKGGSYKETSGECRPARRGFYQPSTLNNNTGLRVACRAGLE